MLAMLASASNFLQSQAAADDVLYLKDGTVVKGVILHRIPHRSVTVQTVDGKTIEFNVSEIQAIIRGSTVEKTAELVATDILYLKNGTIVRGEILHPDRDESITMRTVGRDTIEYQRDEIQTIVREGGIEYGPEKEIVPLRNGFMLFGGVAIPTGDFASVAGNEAGFATPGFAFGGGYNIYLHGINRITLSLSFAFLPVDTYAMRKHFGVTSDISLHATQFTVITPIVGFGVYEEVSAGFLFYGEGLFGAMLGATPGVTVAAPAGTLTQFASSTTEIAYGFQAGCSVGRTFTAGLRFLMSKPTYVVTMKDGPQSFDIPTKQPSNTFQILLGINL